MTKLRRPADPSAAHAALVDRTRSAPPVSRPLRPADVLALQRAVGNTATTHAVQRKIGWTQNAKVGKGWNAAGADIGKIHRLPLDGLTDGLQTTTATHKGKTETTAMADLTRESAEGKAIVLVFGAPATKDAAWASAVDPTQPVEVVVQLHGFTEFSGRPFAGWRELEPTSTKNALRQGVDATDVAPVRDVALDQAEQQLQDSGSKQTIIVLPQGGLHSQFGKDGSKNFNSDTYTGQILDRLVSEKVLSAKPVKVRVVMSGHSGAGATLAAMANESVAAAKGEPSPSKGKSSGLSGDLVIFDAINSDGDLDAFADWAKMRLAADLAAIKGLAEDKRKDYLRAAPKLLAYHSQDFAYPAWYKHLDERIDEWFRTNKKEIGTLKAALRANFPHSFAIDVHHEELMRGSAAGSVRAAGTGTILDAIDRLHGKKP